MSSLSDIKRRLASVKQTRQITGAMETVSVAKMRKAAEKLDGSRAYINILCDMFAAVIPGIEFDEQARDKTGRDILVVLSSDKGMCGSFDQDILRLAESVVTENTTIIPIGAVASELFRDRKNVDLSFADKYSAETDNANNIASKLSELYDGGAKSISIVYSKMVARTGYAPAVKRILPPEIAVSAEKSSLRPVLCEPSPKEVYETLLPLYVSGIVYGALVETVASEHCARRAAMSAATESADAIISALSVEYNRARQAKVTEQIVEIIGSTEALKGNGNEKRI